MSHASGEVKFNDGLILHYEYDGTTDVCRPTLFNTKEEMWKYWRDYSFYNVECKCGKDENVIISNTYGGGSEWDGRACRHCKCITKGIYYNNSEYIDDVYVGW